MFCIGYSLISLPKPEFDSARAGTALEHELASKSAIVLTKLGLLNTRMVLDRLKYRCAESRILHHCSYEKDRKLSIQIN
jgi:hypothetical protein